MSRPGRRIFALAPVLAAAALPAAFLPDSTIDARGVALHPAIQYALDSQRAMYSAQQDLITTQLVQELNLVTLFRVLGGGWSDAGLVRR